MGYLKVVGLLSAALLLMTGLSFWAPVRSAPASQNLLRNAGFEAGTQDWTVQPSTATFDVVSEPVQSGLHAASLTKIESSSWAFIYQDVPVIAGSHYTAQVWAVWNDEQLTNVKLRVDWLDADGEEVADRDETTLDERSSVYQSLSLPNLEAPARAARARVQGYTYVNQPDPGEPALFDDFYFAPAGEPSATPEPTSTATTMPTVVLPSVTPSPTATLMPISPGAVVINEVFYDPPAPGGDPDDEWVELYNATPHTINLEGWLLADHIGEDTLPAVALSPRDFGIVAASDSFSARYPSYDGLLVTLDAPIGNGLANSGDSLWLRDDGGHVIDAITYGDAEGPMSPPVPAAPEGYSLERVPFGRDTDTAGDWFPRANPSPGRGITIRLMYLPLVNK